MLRQRERRAVTREYRFVVCRGHPGFLWNVQSYKFLESEDWIGKPNVIRNVRARVELKKLILFEMCELKYKKLEIQKKRKINVKFTSEIRFSHTYNLYNFVVFEWKDWIIIFRSNASFFDVWSNNNKKSNLDV